MPPIHPGTLRIINKRKDKQVCNSSGVDDAPTPAQPEIGFIPRAEDGYVAREKEPSCNASSARVISRTTRMRLATMHPYSCR